jgi:aryl-phospho-beta-D-glucosidase BglC (GH1 family)
MDVDICRQRRCFEVSYRPSEQNHLRNASIVSASLKYFEIAIEQLTRIPLKSLDSDGSGTSTACVSSSIGSQRIADATAWLKANGKKGIIGEFAGGANSNCESAVADMLTYMKSDTDVWTGALWWGGGPW